MRKYMNTYLKLLVSVGVCEIVGLAATPFTIAAIPGWYTTLNKPVFSPPNFVFGPVWTILYLFMGISAYLVWSKGLKKRGVKEALTFFVVQLGLNFLWSLLFFGLHSPLIALVDIAALIIAILIVIRKFYKVSKTAGYLLVPYLLWVSFAGYLNLSIWLLNR